MTPAKCRAARALLDISITSLAGAAVVPASAMDFESGVAAPNEASIMAMRKALEKAGVEFIEDGVKLRRGGK
jgi:hypothetical protein